MAEAQGKAAGLGPDEHKWIIRLDNDSSNMSKPGGDGTKWLRKVSISVPVVDRKTGAPTIEEVGTLEAWYWPSKEEAAEAKEAAEPKLTPEQTEKIIGAFITELRNAHRGGKTRARKKSPDWFGYAAMPAVGIDDVTNKDNKAQMEKWLRLLVDSGDLKEVTEIGPDRHPAVFLALSEKTIKRLDASEK